MAKLVVLRGDTIDRKIDLVQLPARIGRGPNNQVVLQDPMKGVSREHAEIRLVDGRYLLVDLGSENGIWVAGRRVAEIALEPNVIASIGPFRLMLAEEATVPDTEVVKQMQRPAAVAVPPVSKPAAPQPAPRAPAARPAAGPPVNRRNWLVGGAVAALVVAGIWLGTGLLEDDSPTPKPIEDVPRPLPDINARLTDAARYIDEGRCTEAVQIIDATLADYPNNDSLLKEKRRAEQDCRPTPVPTGLDVKVELQRAQGSLDAGDCPAALVAVNSILTQESQNAEAVALKAKVDQCLSARSPAPPPPPRLAVAFPPENGGLTVKPGELERDYQRRVNEMRARYDEAIAALARGVDQSLIATLQGILDETSPTYLDITERLDDARKQYQALARAHVKRAQDLVAKEMWDDVIAEVNEAKKIDPKLAADPAVQKIEAIKIERGIRACNEAKPLFTYDPTEGARQERLARKLLPPDHSCLAGIRTK